MKDEKIQQLVIEVISRLAQRLGADGRRGTLIAIFTGATAAFSEAIGQVRSLVLDGYKLELVFSQSAEELYGKVVRDRLAGFPHIMPVDASKWFTALKKAHAIVVPLLSVNTLSKASMLIADNVQCNLMVHALFMGKAVIVAQNGAHPDGGHWGRKHGPHKLSSVLRKSLLNRLQTLNDYGCHVIDTANLRQSVNAIIADGRGSKVYENNNIRTLRSILNHSGKMVTAADIRHAHRMETDLSVSPASLITPLARDLAMQYGVTLLMEDKT